MSEPKWLGDDHWFNKSMAWVDARFPLTETFEYHMSRYYAPKNFNFL
jgi:ubiquinol-cytochrome c reductase cytochrome b subunit